MMLSRSHDICTISPDTKPLARPEIPESKVHLPALPSFGFATQKLTTVTHIYNSQGWEISRGKIVCVF